MATKKRMIYLDDLLKFPIRNNNYDFVLGIESVLEYAKNLPTVDAVEVVHGQWELYPSSMHRRCSVCKMEYDKPKFNVRAKYCPNCGAKMDGERRPDG